MLGMINKNNKKPEFVNISSTELEEIKLRVSTDLLSANDKKIVMTILTTYQFSTYATTNNSN